MKVPENPHSFYQQELTEQNWEKSNMLLDYELEKQIQSSCTPMEKLFYGNQGIMKMQSKSKTENISS